MKYFKSSKGRGFEVGFVDDDVHNGLSYFAEIINFGDRQSDAIEFTRDINNGTFAVPSESWLIQAAKNYDPQKLYRYDNGVLTLQEKK